MPKTFVYFGILPFSLHEFGMHSRSQFNSGEFIYVRCLLVYMRLSTMYYVFIWELNCVPNCHSRLSVCGRDLKFWNMLKNKSNYTNQTKEMNEFQTKLEASIKDPVLVECLKYMYIKCDHNLVPFFQRIFPHSFILKMNYGRNRTIFSWNRNE